MNHLLSWLLPASLAAAALLAAGVTFAVMRRARRKESALMMPESFPALTQNSAVDQYLYDRCCRYMMEKKPFLVSSFSLQDLASAVYTNKSYLSRTINRYSGKNFRQYVNYYRVMYAMELFRGNLSLRVTDLTQLSGFRSQTVFLRNFKLVMGEAPSVWCARVRRKQSRKT